MKRTKQAPIIATQTTLRQSVEFTLRKQETYSPIARNIFSLIHLQMKRDADNLFYIFRKDIESITGEMTCSDDIKSGLDQLRNTAIWINDIRLSSNLIASWQQINGGLFEVEMSEKLMKYFIDVKESYTEYTLENMVNLKKKYSKRVYEILAGFCKQETCTIGLEKFKEYLFIKSLQTDKDRYPRWVDFNRKVLEPSITEINTITDLRISCIPKKEGKKVQSLIFYFSSAMENNVRQLSITFPDMDEDKKYFEILRGKYGLRADQCLQFLKQNDFKTESKKMHDYWCRSLESSAANPGYIKNLGAYIVKMYGLNP